MSTQMTISPAEIKALRKRLGLTQQGLADKLGLTRVAVTHWEAGRNCPTGPAGILLMHLRIEADLKKTEKMPPKKKSGIDRI